MTMIENQHSLQKTRLMRQAATIRLMNGVSRSQSVMMAHQIQRLIYLMHQGKVDFSYTKQDGTVRRATGTLTGYEHDFHQPYSPRPENTFIVYYDIEVQGWRTFHVENFLEIHS